MEITLRAAAGSEGVQHESEEVVDESQCHGRQSWQMGIAPWDRPDFSNGTPFCPLGRGYDINVITSPTKYRGSLRMSAYRLWLRP